MPTNPSDGPPARNTRSAAARATRSEQTRESTPRREESVLTSIASSRSDRQSTQLNESTHSESERETIRETQEEAHDQEQSYTTAPGSIGPSARINRSRVSSEEHRRSLSIPSRDDEEIPRRRDRRETSRRPDDEWTQVMGTMNELATMAERNRAELTNLRMRVDNSFESTNKMMDNLNNIQRMIERVRNQHEERHEPPSSPRTLATRAVYADRGSNEGTLDYELRKNAQARFLSSRFIERSRAEEGDESNASSQIRTATDRGHTRSNTQARQRAGTRAHRDPHDRTSDWSGIGSNHREPSGYSSDEDERPQRGNGARSREYSTSTAGPRHNVLDQDYARRSMSLQPQRTTAPMTPPTRGRKHAPQMSAEGDHENHMIDSLRRHIHESLTGIPDDLPELKGIRAKMPDPYEGEDDFERMDSWLQGLLRYFKIHRLTGAGKDRDRVLVTGTSLSGKAERWFSHEVERPTRIIRDWTFESVVVGLFQAFITTATAQQAMERYMQVRFSRDEGVMGFHRDLLTWAGRLAQYPDTYSFKRRLFNGLPDEYRRHLALYDGISAEHSSIDDIVQKARQLEKTLISLRAVRGPGRSPGQHTATQPGRGRHESGGSRDRHRPREPPTSNQHQNGNDAHTGAHPQRAPPRPIERDRTKAATPNPSAPRDTSKMTCYRCGKVGHISSDSKCPQYKKSEQRQLFAAQVIADQDQIDPGDTDAREEEAEPDAEVNRDEEINEPREQDTFPDGSQYDDEDLSYEDYEGYQLPSDNEESVYVRAMREPTTYQRTGRDEAPMIRIATARDDTNTPREREFRAAQRHNATSGDRPQTSGNDRHCMAALVKVNGLEAYALIDTGSTTASVTHDFARVAKLKVMQLENPVTLQLGTVGSRSMINFGARTRLELGPVREDDAYLDVINIDRYDMIIGTPFMRKHGFVLDFNTNSLRIRGEIVPTLTTGQEDLMLKKRARRARVPVADDGSPRRTAD